ncbi:Putative hydrolase or acyltransferase of alpha/beta superfamily [Rheinheimera sp. A13L]|uniref:alpha/beta fold hydrolase n=1 Tax=Rheinheimera sp. A13L TaxID=506534 RepID=UPI0002124900|nr:alpha/beta hydrolase [Rheinheimera sp. A13L]EGM76600.1 Putative hydrolase or acyltransferase of alpha/beta superfamily [Rheinheimera sp. A13L]
MKNILISLLAIFVLNACATDPAALLGEQFIVKGKGSPTIIFETGAGDNTRSWDELSKALSPHATVVSYDRQQSLSLKARTGKEIAHQLQQKLQAHGLQPPYILVGHSIGGPFALSFATEFPTQTAAVVLVDGRPAGFTQACEQAKGRLCDIPALLKLTLAPWVAAEIDGLEQTYQQHKDYQNFPDIPVVLFSATNPPPLSDDTFMRVWIEQQQLQAKKFRQGKLIVVPDSGHFIHQDYPELVSAEILQLLKGMKSTAS